MNKLISVLIIITFLLSLAGCNLQLTQKDNGGAVQPGQETTSPAVTDPAESPATTPEASTGPELPPVRAIVFDTTVDDPVSEAAPFTGKAALKLTLFETSPGIFAGEVR